jgi:metallophosphoesterase (TIGR03768 family)
MSDIHITDIQSPSQVLYYGEIATQGMSSAYSGSILYTTQVFDTAIRTVNKMNSNPNTQLDFGIMLGDAVNNAQRNELQMYLDVLAGKQIKPNSNLKKNFNTDYTKTFQAEGLKTPWYQVLGNHDHFWQGTYGGSEKVKKALVGDTMMRISAVRNSKETEGEAIYGGIIDASTPLGKIVGSGKSNGHDSDTHKLPANPERKFLEAKDFVSMIPNGHGLKIDANNPLACYTFEPKANVPLRVIVLDNTAKQDEIFLDNEKGQPVTTAALATLSFEKLKWLKTELDRAQRDKKLIVVATHIPTNMPGIWSKTSEVSETEFIDTLRSYPNMTLLLAGHRHLNTVVAYPTKDATKPELGFWQVETASLRDFPQQFRVFKFNLNDDGTLSIIATDVDPIVTKGSLMEISRKYAIAASQIFPEPKGIVVPKEKSRAYNA